MLRYLIMVVSVSLSALGAVKFLHENPDALETAAVVARDQMEVRNAKRSTSSQKKNYSLHGTERLRADSRGHYVAQVMLNNSRVTGVIDTGATMIAMTKSNARRAGIHVAANDFVYSVNTANGTVKAARAMVKEVRLGSIRVRNVDAMILNDESLGTVLIGMSFLNRLRNFEFSNGTLEMKL